MAQAIACDVCGTEPASLLVTNVGNGDVLAFGGDCAGDGLAALAATLQAAPPAAELDPSTTRIDTAPAQPADPDPAPGDAPETTDPAAVPTGPDSVPGTTPDTGGDSSTDGTNEGGGDTGGGESPQTGDPGDPGSVDDRLDEQRQLAAATAPY